MMDKQEKKPHVRIGTIGHVDHGKDALTAAIIKTLENNQTKVFEDLNDSKTCEVESGISLIKSYKKLK